MIGSNSDWEPENQILQEIGKDFKEFLNQQSEDLNNPTLLENPKRTGLVRGSVGDFTYCLVRFPVAEPKKKLSKHQLNLAHLVAQGLTNAEIAKQLGIHKATVGNLLNQIYNKLGIGSRAELIRYEILLSCLE